MTTQVISQIASSGGDYTSLQAWYNARKGDLTVRDTVEIAEVNGETFTGVLVMDTQTTDATRYFWIRAKSGAEFKGDFTASGVSTISNNSNAAVISLYSNYTICEGLLVKCLNGTTTGSVCIYGAGNTNGIIRNCGVSISINGNFTQAFGLEFAVLGTIYNCVVDQCGLTYTGSKNGSSYGILFTNTASGSFCYNNTVVNVTGSMGTGTSISAYGIADQTASGITLENNLILNVSASATSATVNQSCISAPAPVLADYNATSDATAAGAHSLTNLTASNEITNTTAGSVNCHLLSGATCRSAGTNLSGTFTTDIDGQTRSTWDIGADEYSTPIVPIPVVLLGF